MRPFIHPAARLISTLALTVRLCSARLPSLFGLTVIYLSLTTTVLAEHPNLREDPLPTQKEPQGTPVTPNIESLRPQLDQSASRSARLPLISDP